MTRHSERGVPGAHSESSGQSGSVGVVAVTRAGRRLAQRIADAQPARVTVIDLPTAAEGLKAAFARYDAVVAVMAAGAVMRILAPLVAAGHKSSDPAVLVVDEAGRFVIPLLGGHAAGANKLATELAETLGAQAVITTATDTARVSGLDELGWPVSGDVSGVGRALLDGEKVILSADHRWPLPALGENVLEVLGDAAPADGPMIVVSDLAQPPAGDGIVVLRPPSLVAGMGASRGVSAEEARLLLETALDDAGLAIESVAAIATAQIKGDEPGLVALARQLRVPLVTHSAAALGQGPDLRQGTLDVGRPGGGHGLHADGGASAHGHGAHPQHPRLSALGDGGERLVVVRAHGTSSEARRS